MLLWQCCDNALHAANAFLPACQMPAHRINDAVSDVVSTVSKTTCNGNAVLCSNMFAAVVMQ